MDWEVGDLGSESLFMTRRERGLRDLQAQHPPERTQLSKVAKPTALIPEEDLSHNQNKYITSQAGQVGVP